jgi:predicted nucleic acid-binding protein
MTVHLDTSAIIAAFAGSRPAFSRLTQLVADGHRLAMSTLADYEWRRGPRSPDELDIQQAVVPREALYVFGPDEAARAAALYQLVRRPRARAFDLAIAACAIEHGAVLWTANRTDFDDIPELRLL